MTAIRHYLAQVNVGRIRAPMEDPVMDGFRTQLDRIDAIADASPGFVWRLQTAEGNATAFRPYEDERTLINMSVWESFEALHDYVYVSDHVHFLRRRREWFEPFDGPMLALWWIPTGHVPSIEEAKAKLELLKEHGPTPDAFTFRSPFPPPGAAPRGFPEVDAEFCAR